MRRLDRPRHAGSVRRVTSDRRLLGVALALTSAASFGVMPVLTKVIYEDGADPIGVLAVRFTIAACVLQALARTRREVRPAGRTLALLAGLGAIGYVGQALCYFFALERISAGLTALLLYVFPALVVVLAAVVLRDRPRPLAVGCVVLATLGTAFAVGPVSGGQVSGVLLGLAAALIYAVYILVSSTVVGVGPFATTAWVLTASAVVMGALALATGPRLPSSATAWLALLGVALVGTVVAVTTFFAALTLLGPSDTAVISTVEPVVSIAVAALVLGERLGPLQLAGGAVVLLAVGVLARTRPAPEPVPV